jgi:hypothetical protein
MTGEPAGSDPKKSSVSPLVSAITGRFLNLITLVIAVVVIAKFIPVGVFLFGTPVMKISAAVLVMVLIMGVIIVRNAIVCKEWCLFPPRNQQEKTPRDIRLDRDPLSLQEQIGKIAGTLALIFLYLIVLSALFGIQDLALAPPLTFNIFFWIFSGELAGFILSCLLWIRCLEGKWGLIPGYAEWVHVLGKRSAKYIRLLVFWNGLCFIWMLVNLYFLYSGTPLIDTNTYGEGLGVMVIGNVVIGLFLGLSQYGK